MRYAIGKVSGVFIGAEKAIKFFGLRKKGVKPTRGTLRECYEREVECLRRLQGHPGFPILHAARDKEMIVEMENCGEHLFSTWHEHNLMLYLDQANRICDGLEKANIQYFFAGLRNH